MTFEQALNALRQGMKVARDGWEDKGAWIVLKSNFTLLEEDVIAEDWSVVA